MFKREDYISWNEYFMGIAILSGKRSKDPTTQVGACIIDEDKKIVGIGYNGFPIGSSDDNMPWGKNGDFLETKYPYVVHAELNAILNSTFIQKHINDGQYNQLSTEKIGDLPIINIDETNEENLLNYNSILEFSNKQISNYKAFFDLQSNVSKFIETKFNIAISNWNEIDFQTLISLFVNAKIKLSLSEESEWMRYFNEEKLKIQKITTEIEQIDNEIDKIVYELYGIDQGRNKNGWGINMKTNRPKSKKSHSKTVFIFKSLAVAFIAFYNRAEQSQYIVF